MYINSVTLFGNLTRDPELRALPSGMNVVNFSVATNKVYTDRDGKKQEQTDFHSVVVFGRQADSVSQFLRKGSSVLVEGRMQTRSWDDKDGVKHYRTEVVAERVQFGPRKGRGEERQQDGDFDLTKKDAEPAETKGIEYPKVDINPDDIPF